MFRRKKDETEEVKPPMPETPPAAAASEPETAEMVTPRPFPRPTPPSPGALARAAAAPLATPAPRPPATPAPVQRGEAIEGRKLIVGREIVLSGQITSCERLIVEGRVEASLSESRFVDIAESGVFKGMAEIENAEIAGTFEGTLNVREKLWIRSTGKVSGTVRYGRIEIEEGGQIAGEVQVDTSRLGKPEGNDGG
ncbi:MAG: polymer-forming cytoskeletal protein [Magnetospirillum sp.]|jgi:cytoskeletal protein CcmA (bactofilin family)|nr:polymer-forming cytoskeletal protein [Magnetospirillum sp.]